LEAQSVLTAALGTVADLSTPLSPAAEIESFMPWVDAAASRHARAHVRLFAS
jgi:urease accessory protein UreF